MHLATFDGNLFLLVLLLHQDIPVDAPDPQGHTCLMWAAYKGFPACVDLFLRWGANVHATDETGFTALHWALVKGSHACIQKLVEHGCDRFAETSTGKTPSKVAEEMHSVRAWHRALADCGYDEGGFPKNYVGLLFLRRRGFLTKFFFLWPFLIVWSVVMILSHMVIYAAIPLAAVAGYTLQWVATQMLQFAPPDMKHLHRTVSLVIIRSRGDEILSLEALSGGHLCRHLLSCWCQMVDDHFARSVLYILLSCTQTQTNRYLLCHPIYEHFLRHLLRPVHGVLLLQHGFRPGICTETGRPHRTESRHR